MMSNILMITQRYPYPTDRGDKVRVFNIAEQFAKKHNVYCLNFTENGPIVLRNDVFKNIYHCRKPRLRMIADMLVALFLFYRCKWLSLNQGK